MISLSLRSTGHPLRFQPKWVRPSTGSYPRFSLPMDSSPGFASTACNSNACLSTRFRCGSFQNSASLHTSNSLAHSTKGTLSPCRGQAPGLPGSNCLWAHGFRYCFTPLSGCFSPFPHGTCSLSVAGECSALEGGPPCFAPGFTCPALLWDRESAAAAASRTGLSPCLAGLPRPFRCRRGF